MYVLIAIGAVMMFVGFLGCYGAIQESQCLLGTVGFYSDSHYSCCMPLMHFNFKRALQELNYTLLVIRQYRCSFTLASSI